MFSYSNFELRKFVTPEIVFGLDARLLTARYAKNLGAKKVLIVTDPGVLATGLISEIIEGLKAQRIDYTVFSEVHENPRDFDVIKGVGIFLDEGCNLIIAAGGGSPMDCAKGIGVVSTNGGDILDYEGVDKVMIPGPPLICIPTTSGSSADVSQFAIILDSKRKVKIAIISKAVVPDVALIDPRTLVTMDRYLTACTSMDALTHAIEAFVSTAQSPMTNLNAFEAIKIINDNLIKAIQNPENINYLGNLMLGSFYAGLAFSNASLGAVHAMAHSLGGMFDLPHGECNAILLEPVIQYNFWEAEQRYVGIASQMHLSIDGKSPDTIMKLLLDRVAYLRAEVGIKNKFEGLPIDGKKITILAENALNDPCMVTNPVYPTIKDLVNLYERVL